MKELIREIEKDKEEINRLKNLLWLTKSKKAEKEVDFLRELINSSSDSKLHYLLTSGAIKFDAWNITYSPRYRDFDGC